MVESLDHRGPDATGWCRRDRCLLGNARLSIIDLDSGDQPMGTEDRYTIVYNGEIYNYREVRERLKELTNELLEEGRRQSNVAHETFSGVAWVGRTAGPTQTMRAIFGDIYRKVVALG